MEKAILSRINLQRQDTHIAQEYFDTISDLIDTQEVQGQVIISNPFSIRNRKKLSKTAFKINQFSFYHPCKVVILLESRLIHLPVNCFLRMQSTF